MKPFWILLTCILITITLLPPAQAAIYKSVDENGVVTFSDAPPKSTREAEVVQLDKDALGATSGVPAIEEEANSVIIYTTKWCPYCRQAEDFLRANDIPFTNYDVEKDRTAAKRKNRLDPGGGVPFAIINGKKIHGFTETLYRSALNLD